MSAVKARLPKVLRVLLLAVFPLFVLPVAGSSAVSGRIVDENGAPVQNARIAIAAPGGAGAIQTDSDAAGAFRVEIPATGAYRVTVDHEGFFQFVQQQMNLAADSPLEIRINHVREMAESMDVRYSAPAIDAEQTSDTKQLHNPDIQNVPYPASQDYRSALPLMPGAIQDNGGAIHFNGGGHQRNQLPAERL